MPFHCFISLNLLKSVFSPACLSRRLTSALSVIPLILFPVNPISYLWRYSNRLPDDSVTSNQVSFVLIICPYHLFFPTPVLSSSKYNELPTALPERKNVSISATIKLRYSGLSSREWKDEKPNQKHPLPE